MVKQSKITSEEFSTIKTLFNDYFNGLRTKSYTLETRGYVFKFSLRRGEFYFSVFGRDENGLYTIRDSMYVDKVTFDNNYRDFEVSNRYGERLTIRS